MDFKIVILIFVVILNLILAFFVYFKNKKNSINICFSLLILSISIWIFTNAICQIVKSLISAWIWAEISYMSAALIAVSFFYFSLIFPRKLNVLKTYHKYLVYLSIPIIFSVIFIPSFTIKNIILHPWQIITGPGLLIFALYFLFFIGWAFYNLIYKYHLLLGIEKMQLKYILLGTIIAAILGTVCNLIFPLMKNYSFVWLGPIFTVIMVIFITYAIVRYRLMDIALVIRKGFVYTVLLGVSLAAYGIAVFVVGKFLEEAFEINPFLIGALVVLIILFSAEWLKRFIQNYTDKIFFKKRVNLQNVLSELSKIIASTLDLDELLDRLTSQINKVLKTKFSGLFLFDQEEDLFFLKKSAPSGALSDATTLSGTLENYKEIFVLEEIQRKIADHRSLEETKRLQLLRKELEEKNIALFGPVLVRDRIIGILVLGQKLSQDMFTQEEVNFLEIVLGQLGTSIENAKLYKEVQDFNKELIIKIAQATKELREANLELQKLDEAKSDFLSIASHQLRSPLAGIKGYLSMLLEGDFGEISQRQRETLKEVLAQTEKMIQLVQRFLNISRIESGRMILEKKPCQIEELIEEQLREFRPEIERKNLVQEFLRPETPLPKINLDQEDIKLVLKNLIDNALLYTEKGKIVVEVKKNNQEIEVSVSDTGVGLDQEDFSRLFKKFSRIEEGKKIYVQGAGLGLYLAKRIIEAHQGKIWAESEGPGRGSRFSFRIPYN